MQNLTLGHSLPFSFNVKYTLTIQSSRLHDLNKNICLYEDLYMAIQSSFARISQRINQHLMYHFLFFENRILSVSWCQPPRLTFFSLPLCMYNEWAVPTIHKIRKNIYWTPRTITQLQRFYFANFISHIPLLFKKL